MEGYSDDVLEEYSEGRVVQAIATFDKLAFPAQEKTSNIYVFKPVYIQDVSAYATTVGHLLPAPAAIASGSPSLSTGTLHTAGTLQGPFEIVSPLDQSSLVTC